MTNGYKSGYERLMFYSTEARGKTYLYVNGDGACLHHEATFQIIVDRAGATLYRVLPEHELLHIDKRSGDWYHHFQRYLDAHYGIEI